MKQEKLIKYLINEVKNLNDDLILKQMNIKVLQEELKECRALNKDLENKLKNQYEKELSRLKNIDLELTNLEKQDIQLKELINHFESEKLQEQKLIKKINKILN